MLFVSLFDSLEVLMALSSGNIMKSQVKVMFQGQFAVNTFYHTLLAENAPIDIDLYFTPFVNAIAATYPPLMVEGAVIVSIKSLLHGVPNTFETREDTTYRPGTYEAEGLPPFVSATCIEFPDNTSRWPSSSQVFRPGRFALTGIPENAQVGGIMSSAYAALLQDLCDVIKVIPDTSGFGPTLNLFLDRTYDVKTSSGLARCYVDYVQPGRIGSQNTRKT